MHEHASEPFFLPACEPMTVGEMVYGTNMDQTSANAKEVCQSTAKSKASNRVLPDGEAARLFSYLQFGA